MATGGRRHWRRTRRTAAGVAGILAVTALSGVDLSGAGAQTGFNRGVAGAIAESFKIDPRAASLSIGVSFGESLARYQNSVATAESRAVNLGIIGGELAGEACDGGEPTLPAEDQPQPLRTDSTQEGSEAGITESEERPPGFTKYVRATDEPLGEAITTSAPVGDAAIFAIEGARSTARTRVVDGDTREAFARSEIGAVRLAGGLVEIGNMVWEGVHRTGAREDRLGTFTIGSMRIAGQAVPTQDPVEALAAANAALNPLGMELRPPRTHVERAAGGDILFVDPMAVAVVPNAARDALLGTVIRTVQPVRESLVDALLAIDCGNATYVTLLDIAVGSMTGAGSFALSIGGVQAETRAISLFEGLGSGGAGQLPTIGGNLPATGTVPAAPASVAPVASPTAPVPPPAAPAPAARAVDVVTSAAGERGGALAAVGAVGLLLLLLSAEGDRRKMRRAQRLSAGAVA